MSYCSCGNRFVPSKKETLNIPEGAFPIFFISAIIFILFPSLIGGLGKILILLTIKSERFCGAMICVEQEEKAEIITSGQSDMPVIVAMFVIVDDEGSVMK